MKRSNKPLWLLGILLAIRFAGTEGCDVSLPVVAPSTPATAVTYVYEKDAGPIPTPVLAAIDKLNREKKVVASDFEQNTTDGGGDTPEQYKVALAAAKEAGLPALVVQAGDKVLKVVKAPKTDSEVLEAVP